MHFLALKAKFERRRMPFLCIAFAGIVFAAVSTLVAPLRTYPLGSIYTHKGFCDSCIFALRQKVQYTSLTLRLTLSN